MLSGGPLLLTSFILLRSDSVILDAVDVPSLRCLDYQGFCC